MTPRSKIRAMKILVTGSAGHLGEALMRTLRGTSDEPVGLDITPSPFTDHIGSVTDRSFVRRCLRGIDVVVHTATLHKPHIATHTRQDFVDTNITGTLNLLEEALAAAVSRFIYTSTTSVFGRALVPPPGAPTAWITEKVTPIPKNIYGVTKFAAENLCELFHRSNGLPCVVLRTSRFFPEDDDDRLARQRFDSDNLKVNEILYRRADLEDIVSAHLLAIAKAPSLGFERFIISATTPFTRADLLTLRTDAASIVAGRFPQFEQEYARRGWSMVSGIDRVYATDHARAALGWAPRYDFGTILNLLANGQDYRSPLAREVGTKGYHAQTFTEGPYPI
jgi:UDP-glucose 4-epimerase